MEEIQPIGSRLLIRKKLGEEVTSAGVILATAKESNEGEVIAVGNRVKSVKVGDFVLFEAINLIEVNKDERLVIIEEEEAIAII